MFWCFPDSDKCEWKKLKFFVKEYNRLFKTDYILSECLDVFDSTKPQPEVRLKSSEHEHTDIVIEHKIIGCPSDYLQRHSSEHDFIDFFTEIVSPEFQDDVYLLELNSEEIIPKKRIVEDWAKNIADTVIENRSKIRTVGRIGFSQPLNWVFRRLPEYEHYESVPKKGVGVCFLGKDFFGYFESDESEYNKMTEGIKNTLLKHLEKSSKKFKGYRDCLRIFITQMYGEDIVELELIEEIVSSLDIPSNIDQIWIGFPEWIDNCNYEVAYKQVKW